MGIWRIGIYDNELDAHPRERGIIKAETEEAAIEVGNGIMGDSMCATYTLIIAKNESNIKDGYTPLENLK